MTKVLISADLHVHSHKRSTDRLHDCLRCLDWIFQTAADREINAILIAGDLFHDRQKIDVLTYQKTYEIFKKWSHTAKVYLLLGNHDMWHYQKWDVSSVYPLGALPNVQIMNEPCVERIFGVDVAFLPYTHDPIKDIADLKAKVLIAHLAVDGAKFNRHTVSEVSIEHDGEMTKVGANIFSDFKQVFLGHYHIAQQLDKNVEYVGSPLQLDFGEAFQDKHIVVCDLETGKKEYIQNNFSPKHYIIPIKDIGKYELEGNFVRLEIDDDEMLSADAVDARKSLLENHNPGTLEIIPKQTKKAEHVVLDAKEIMLKEDELLERYMSEVGTDLDKEVLLKIGRKIIEAPGL